MSETIARPIVNGKFWVIKQDERRRLDQLKRITTVTLLQLSKAMHVLRLLKVYVM